MPRGNLECVTPRFLALPAIASALRDERFAAAAALAARHRVDLNLLVDYGTFYTLVPIRPRSRGERRSLRTLPVSSLRPPLALNTRPRRLSTSTDAFQLHPDVHLYGTTLSGPSSPLSLIHI